MSYTPKISVTTDMLGKSERGALEHLATELFHSESFSTRERFLIRKAIALTLRRVRAERMKRALMWVFDRLDTYDVALPESGLTVKEQVRTADQIRMVLQGEECEAGSYDPSAWDGSVKMLVGPLDRCGRCGHPYNAHEGHPDQAEHDVGACGTFEVESGCLVKTLSVLVEDHRSAHTRVPSRHEHESGAPLTPDCDSWCKFKLERWKASRSTHGPVVHLEPCRKCGGMVFTGDLVCVKCGAGPRVGAVDE